MMNRWLLVLAGLALWPAAAQSAEPMTPGLWQLSMSIEMAGRSRVMPDVMECIAQKDIDEGNRILPRPEGKCALSNIERSTGGVTYDLACMNGSLQSQGRASVVFEGERYSGTVVMAMSEKGMRPLRADMKMNARRIGECAK